MYRAKVASIIAGVVLVSAPAAQSQICGDVATRAMSVLSARQTVAAKSHISFEGACVSGAIDCSFAPGVAMIIRTTCAKVPPKLQAEIAGAMQTITVQTTAQVSSFVSRCVTAANTGKQLPTDEKIGRNFIICYEFEKSLVEFRAEPVPGE